MNKSRIIKYTLSSSGILMLIMGVALYILSLGFSEYEQYERYSLKYYLLTPEILKDLSDKIECKQSVYEYSAGDGPKPAYSMVTFKNVENISEAVKICTKHFESRGIPIIPPDKPITQEPFYKKSATINTKTSDDNNTYIEVYLEEFSY